MTDLEMTKACAQEMGYEVVQRSARKKDGWWCIDLVSNYDPLHDDAQALALVKKFELSINGNQEEPRWSACWFDPDGEDEIRTHGSNLNRAICECVAKLQAATAPPQ